MVYQCKRGHVTEQQGESDYICCPQIERVPTNFRYGKVCDRLAFDVRNPQGLTIEKEAHEESDPKTPTPGR